MNNQTIWEQYGRHGKWLIIGILAVFFAIGLWQYYEYKQSRVFEKASQDFQFILESMREKNLTQTKERAKLLVKQYPNTSYASLAAMILGRLALEENKVDDAVLHLRNAIKISKDESLYHFAKIRLVRILIEQKKYEDALKMLEEAKVPESYATLYEEAKGDIYLKRHEKDKALSAYTKALKSAPPGVPTTVLQLKQSNLNTKEES